MASLKVAVVIVICMAVVSAPMAQAAVSCGQVTRSLTPCLGYLQKGGAPPAVCCSGIKSVLASAKTTPDRQGVCNCLKAAAGRFPGLNLGNAASLPGKCGVKLPYKISTSTNCATYEYTYLHLALLIIFVSLDSRLNYVNF